MIHIVVNDEGLEAGVRELAAEMHVSTDVVVAALREMRYFISSEEMERRSELAN